MSHIYLSIYTLFMGHSVFFLWSKMKIVRTNETINKAKGQKDKGPIYQKDTMPKKSKRIISY